MAANIGSEWFGRFSATTPKSPCWGRNLLEKEHLISAIDNLPGADRAVLFGEPRTVGAELIYRWR